MVLAGVLAILMQDGFALVVTGSCRAKNAAQVIQRRVTDGTTYEEN
jgi:ammonia channel protein AmtB